MDKSYIVILGNGVTSRANLEALIEDFFYAKDKETYLVIAFDKVPSQGQVFAAQYARDKTKDILIFCSEGANLLPFPASSVSYSSTPILDAISQPNSTIMALWNDSDPDCVIAFDQCRATNEKLYNLCEGLSLINSVEVSEEAPKPVEIPVEPTEPQSLSEALKAEITQSVMAAVEAALQNALKKA